MKHVLQELDKLSRARIAELQQAKRDGKRVIAYTGSFIPEEYIRAAGAEPFLLCRGGEPEAPEAVLDTMLRFMNPLARSMAGFMELGVDPITPIADLIITSQTDNHIGRVSELLEFKGLPIWKVGVPTDWSKEIAFEYYLNSLNKMKKKLEELSGKTIENETVNQLIKKTNRINAALRKIGELRKKDNPPIGLTEFIRLNHYSFNIDPDIMAEKLEELYAKIENAPGKFPGDAPRILFAGHVLAVGDYTVPRLVEESGGAIVCDFLDDGIRNYRVDVDSTTDDPMRAYAKARYQDSMPIDIFQPAWEKRVAFIKKLAEEYRVDGIIWYQLSFDEIYDMEYTCLAKWMKEINMPILKMESSYEYSRESMGPLTTRVESFVESLKGAK